MQEISWGKHLKTKTEVPEKAGKGFSADSVSLTPVTGEWEERKMG